MAEIDAREAGASQPAQRSRSRSCTRALVVGAYRSAMMVGVGTRGGVICTGGGTTRRCPGRARPATPSGGSPAGGTPSCSGEDRLLVGAVLGARQVSATSTAKPTGPAEEVVVARSTLVRTRSGRSLVAASRPAVTSRAVKVFVTPGLVSTLVIATPGSACFRASSSLGTTKRG